MIKHRKNIRYLNNLTELNPCYRKENKIKRAYNSFKGLFSEIDIKKTLVVLFSSIIINSILIQPTIEAIKFNRQNWNYNIEPNKKAILVKSNNYSNIELINHELSRRGYDCKVIDTFSATNTKIFESIDEIAVNSNEETKTVFYISSEGYKGPNEKVSILTVKDYNSNKDYYAIYPYNLFEKLGKIKGKKAIFIDACYSGNFLECKNIEDLIENYVIVAACPEDRITASNFMYIFTGKYTSSLEFNLYKLLTKSEEPINISKQKIPKSNIEYILQALCSIFDISFKKRIISDTDFYL